MPASQNAVIKFQRFHQNSRKIKLKNLQFNFNQIPFCANQLVNPIQSVLDWIPWETKQKQLHGIS